MNRQHAEDQYGDANKAETWACVKVAREGLGNSNSPEFDGIRSAAPAAGTAKDTARLDFMIAEECQIEHVDRIGPPPFYRVRWPWEEREMRAWSATPREAIDAAIAAKEPPCGT